MRARPIWASGLRMLIQSAGAISRRSAASLSGVVSRRSASVAKITCRLQSLAVRMWLSRLGQCVSRRLAAWSAQPVVKARGLKVVRWDRGALRSEGSSDSYCHSSAGRQAFQHEPLPVA